VLFTRKGVNAFFLSSLTLIAIIVMEVKWLGVVVLTQKIASTTTTSRLMQGLGRLVGGGVAAVVAAAAGGVKREGARVKSVQYPCMHRGVWRGMLGSRQNRLPPPPFNMTLLFGSK
jgi:hypothetical protein